MTEGGTRFGWKLVRPDGLTRNGFVWPLTPGATVTADTPDRSHNGPCPVREGDGLSVGLTPQGLAQAGFSSPTLLAVSWEPADELGRDPNKVRVAACQVLAVMDWWRALREGTWRGWLGERANLSRANLYRANLYGAYLSGANLSRANLYRANLYGAYLSGANLSGANLYRANLSGADLYGADLSRANLSGANLSGADLSGANLYGADLSGADLYGADLSRALGVPSDLVRSSS